MRLARALIIMFLFFPQFTALVFSQAVKEEVLYTVENDEDASPKSIYYDPKTGKFCYVKYYPDNDNLMFNDFSIVYNGKESIRYEYNSGYRVLFDSKGNYYAVVNVRQGEDPILLDSINEDSNSYIVTGNNSYDAVLFNSDSIYGGRIEGGSLHITPNDEFQFTAKKGDDRFVIVTYSPDKGISESKEYFYIENMYNGVYNYLIYMDTQPHDSLKWRDENGNAGHLVSDGEKMTILIGEKEIKTDYYHAYAAGFTLDRKGELSYIATIGSRYFGDSGKAFVVQGDRKYREFDMVYYPVMFNSKNEPIYIAEDKTEGLIEYYLMSGDSIILSETFQPDEVKTGKGMYWSINHLKSIEKNGYKLYDTVYNRMLNNIGDLYIKTGYSFRGYIGALLYPLANMVFDTKGNAISFLVEWEKPYSQKLVIWNKDMEFEEVYDTNQMYLEYGFTMDDKAFFIGSYKDHKKGKSKSTLYINGKAIESFPEIELSQSITGPQYRKGVYFNSKNEYAFIGGTYKAIHKTGFKNVLAKFVVTSNGVQIPEGIENGFDRINYLAYLKNDRLFYIGVVDDKESEMTQSFVVIDGKSIPNRYDRIDDIIYDRDKDLISFIASRGSNIYKVIISF